MESRDTGRPLVTAFC